MPRFHGSLRFFRLLLTMLCVGLPALAASLPVTGLMGTVRSSDGKAMEGVAVSARAQDKTFTTSVYTNRDGEYYFPALSGGQYRVWAQAVGFETARSEQRIASGKKIQQNFAMKPMQDFSKQLSGAEWSNSLPEGTPEDRRLKQVFQYNCTGCHITGFVLSKRFDAAGWGLIVNAMIDHETQPDSLQRRLLQAYKEEMVGYLTRIRGPEASPLKFKPLPRATGDATEIVVTEFDVPRADQPNNVVALNGSDWSEGVAGRTETSVLHDAVVGKDGNIYFTDNSTPERSVGRLDPRTGRVTSFKLAGKDEMAVSTHGAVVDRDGSIWVTNLTENTFIKFDPKTERFQRFPREGSMGRSQGWISIALDIKGNLWSSEREGTIRLNPATGEYTEFKTPTKGGQPYGMTTDSEGNAWFAQLVGDKVSFVDAHTGQVSEIDMAPVNEEFNARDREIGKAAGGVASVPPVYQKGPRRLAADPKGDSVWVAEFWGGRLAKIDIHTKKVTEYTVPSPTSHPYSTMVDKNHMVWIPLMNGDRILKFNPFTEQFTEYPLPTLGTNARFADIDNSTDVPTVWVPYTGANKIARVQFRTGSPGQMAVNGR